MATPKPQEDASSREEILREEIEQLESRLDRTERENAELRAANEKLRDENERWKGLVQVESKLQASELRKWQSMLQAAQDAVRDRDSRITGLERQIELEGEEYESMQVELETCRSSIKGLSQRVASANEEARKARDALEAKATDIARLDREHAETLAAFEQFRRRHDDLLRSIEEAAHVPAPPPGSAPWSSSSPFECGEDTEVIQERITVLEALLDRASRQDPDSEDTNVVGTLEVMSIDSILRWARESCFTGLLVVEPAREASVEVIFGGGYIISVTTDGAPDDLRLCQILISRGVLSHADAQRVLVFDGSAKPVGERLVDAGLLSVENICDALRYQSLRHLMRLKSCRLGVFTLSIGESLRARIDRLEPFLDGMISKSLKLA